MSEQLREEFKRRKRRQWLVAIPFFGAQFVLAMADDANGVMTTVLVIAGAALILGAIGFSVWNWRCPSCEGLLGRGRNETCGNCGFRLRE